MSGQNKVDLKVVLLGQAHVGKTCLINRYLHNHFGNTCSTVGAAFALKRVTHGDHTVNLGLWDTAGQERFDSLSNFYCRKAQAAIICYDITHREGFDIVPKWAKKVQEEAEPDCHIVLVGTKLDLATSETRAVSAEEGQQLALSFGGGFIETSSKNSLNVKEMFDEIVENFLAKHSQTDPKQCIPPIKIRPVANQGEKSGKCCG